MNESPEQRLPDVPASARVEPVGRGVPPRNYFARGERRRIFWMGMPPAILAVLVLGWIERTWFPRPRPPVPQQVDTSLEAVRGPQLAGDAVLIEPDPEPFTPAAGSLSASVDALAKIRDDAFFRKDEEPAWLETFNTLRASDNAALRRTAAPVSFTELFGQPRTFRGRPIRFKGELRRLEKVAAPANDAGVGEYWQGWLEPADGPASPIVVHFLRVPEGMPTGLKIAEPVEVAGYFFKRYAYAASDTIRRAPLVIALEPFWTPRPPLAPGGTSLGTVAVVTLAAVVAATMLALRLANGGPTRRRRPDPVDLTTALADVELHSTAESLRRLEQAAAATDSQSFRETSP